MKSFKGSVSIKIYRECFGENQAPTLSLFDGYIAIITHPRKPAIKLQHSKFKTKRL